MPPTEAEMLEISMELGEEVATCYLAKSFPELEGMTGLVAAFDDELYYEWMLCRAGWEVEALRSIHGLPEEQFRIVVGFYVQSIKNSVEDHIPDPDSLYLKIMMAAQGVAIIRSLRSQVRPIVHNILLRFVLVQVCGLEFRSSKFDSLFQVGEDEDCPATEEDIDQLLESEASEQIISRILDAGKRSVLEDADWKTFGEVLLGRWQFVRERFKAVEIESIGSSPISTTEKGSGCLAATALIIAASAGAVLTSFLVVSR